MKTTVLDEALTTATRTPERELETGRQREYAKRVRDTKDGNIVCECDNDVKH